MFAVFTHIPYTITGQESVARLKTVNISELFLREFSAAPESRLRPTGQELPSVVTGDWWPSPR